MMKFVFILAIIIPCLFAWQNKIAFHVQNTLALRQRVNIAIEMKEQANFKDLSNLPLSHDTKGHIIVNGLMKTAKESQAGVISFLKKERKNFRSLWIVNTIFVDQADEDLITALAKREDVAAISSNEECNGLIESFPNKAIYTNTSGIEWNVKWINAHKVWEMGFKGAGMVVGGIDTGVHQSHEAIEGQYRGKNSDGSLSHDYNWWDGVREQHSGPCKFRNPEPCDDNGHGTHTVGTAVGGIEDKWIGVAPEAKWIGCRTMAQGRNSLERTLSCLQFMIAPTDLDGNNPNPSLRPHSTINSYQCSTCSRNALKEGFERMKEAGIVMAVAAGNAGSRCGSVTQPGYLESVLTVAALDKESHKAAYFSSRGPVTFEDNRRKPDISAPGVNVVSAVPPNRYVAYSGTSMATPATAGAIVLLWNAVPELERDIDRTYEVLFKTALNQPTDECQSNGSPNNVYGYGTIDLLKAVTIAKEMYGRK